MITSNKDTIPHVHIFMHRLNFKISLLKAETKRHNTNKNQQISSLRATIFFFAKKGPYSLITRTVIMSSRLILDASGIIAEIV